MMEKVMVAMSGGVDSSVAALLTIQKGHSCVGATMLLWGEGTAADAQRVCQQLGIPFHVLDHRADFCREVVDSFIASYECGDTPNPCYQCNIRVKFGILLDKAISMGYGKLATGHYARIRQDAQTGRYLLYRAADSSKDQSYFLAGLSQHQLSHTLFPLGELTKEQVRSIAETNGFINARKKDSQDICFIPDGDYVAFMKEHTGKTYPTGNYLDLTGNVVGSHAGAVCYTIGQRRGLGIAMGEPVYVCSKDMENNTVTVGPNEALFRDTLLADSWNFIPFSDLREPLQCRGKVRYRHEPQPATVYPEENGMARVVFDTPQRAITPGQTVVLYDDDMVLGSGTIRKTF